MGIDTDTYFTIAYPTEGIYKDKGSKFLAFAYPISQEDQIKEIVSGIKKEHHSARHHCFAWKLGTTGENFRVNDDGEPSGTAGRPILGQIQSKGLTNVLIVVVRYFGGSLLGVSGLINAYKQAALETLNNAEIIERVVEEVITIDFNYLAMNDIMQLIKEMQLQIISSDFGMKCSVSITVRANRAETVLNKLNKIEGITVIEHTNQ